MFVAEAPGRFGAERTGIPLCGDRSGDRFEALLTVMSLERHLVFVTNAVLCNPLNENGHNSAPTRKELANCSGYLARTIKLVNPLIVISLGRVALQALALVCRHDLRLREAAGRIAPWNDRMLGVLYHPSPRTIVHRPWSDQLDDARALRRAAERLL